MALISVTTANRVEVVESFIQTTLVANEAIVAGAPVRIDTDGKFTNGNGTDTTENNVYGVALRSAAAGEPVTAIRKGVLAGFTFSQAYNAAIYVADTDGRLGDVAGTASKVVGRVIPGTASATPGKLLFVDL